jgi:hypothetical protein
MNHSLFDQSPLDEAFTALRRDLIHEEGPQISTMRNYRFAIVQYEPKEEYKLRSLTQTLSNDLVANGWVVVSISLQNLLLDRVRAQGDEWLQWVIEAEREFAEFDPERGLNFLKEQMAPLIEGTDGLAKDCAKQIREYVEEHPEQKDRTLALIGRAGALYPFFRSSSLLKHLDGQTGNVPAVLLYPGERAGATGLSFMGVLSPDNDYRPRIYP